MATVIALFEARMWKGVRPLLFHIERASGHFLMKSSRPAAETGAEVRIGVRVEGWGYKNRVQHGSRYRIRVRRLIEVWSRGIIVARVRVKVRVKKGLDMGPTCK
jgi:hypothetical protein